MLPGQAPSVCCVWGKKKEKRTVTKSRPESWAYLTCTVSEWRMARPRDKPANSRHWQTALHQQHHHGTALHIVSARNLRWFVRETSADQNLSLSALTTFAALYTSNMCTVQKQCVSVCVCVCVCGGGGCCVGWWVQACVRACMCVWGEGGCKTRAAR